MAGICIGHRASGIGSRARQCERARQTVPVRPCASGCCVKRQLQLHGKSIFLSAWLCFYDCLQGCAWPPPPSRPRLQLCVLVYHDCDCDSGCLCVALALALASWSSSWSWSCLLAPPFADTTCLILVLETLCWLLFLPNCAPAPSPAPLCHSALSSRQRQSLVARLSRLASLSLGACVSFIYDYLCTTCFVFIACRCR